MRQVTSLFSVFQQAGRLALGSRLRSLGELLAEQGRTVYEEYDLDIQPTWFPVFYRLRHVGESSISDIADAIGHTHASVSQMSRRMQKSGLTESRPSPSDGRIRLLRLSVAAEEYIPRFDRMCDDVAAAAHEMLDEISIDLWTGLSQLETLLREEDFGARVRRQSEEQGLKPVEIRRMRHEDTDEFARLNREWIEQYFRMEPADERMLGDPFASIVDQGGEIFVAESDGMILGVCALVQREDRNFELAKMAVRTEARRRGIGYRLGRRIVDEARQRGGRRILIESNTVLGPAVNLYRKLGFVEITDHRSPYKRSNIALELLLDGTGA